MTKKPLIAAVVLLTTLAASPIAHASYGWPVKPFDQPHPVRGSFGDPRTLFFGPPTPRTLATGRGKFQFHFGVDISAPNGTAVYPVESGVVTRATEEEINVASAGGHTFEYWHLDASVRVGEHVVAARTVLGLIAPPCAHVHLSELENGVFVNPLQRRHLTPYTDTTRPTVTATAVRGGKLLAAAHDTPMLPVPGGWNGLPVTPARVAWRLEREDGDVAVPTRVVYDVTTQLPAPASFWAVYARGTHQNMTAFTKYYAYGQPGKYLFRLTPGALRLPKGTYRLVVTATDIRGNSGSLSKRLRLGA